MMPFKAKIVMAILVGLMIAGAAEAESLKRSKHGEWTVYADFRASDIHPSCSMMLQRPAIMMGQFVFFDYDTIFMNISRPTFAYASGTPVHGRLTFRGRTPIPLSGFGDGLNANFALPVPALQAIRDAVRTSAGFSVEINGAATEVSGDGWETALSAVKDCLSEGFNHRVRGGVRPGSMILEMSEDGKKADYRLWAYRDAETSNPIGCSVAWRNPKGAVFEFMFPGIDADPALMLAQNRGWRFADGQNVAVTFAFDGVEKSVEARTRWDAVIVAIPDDIRKQAHKALLEGKPITVSHGGKSVQLTATDSQAASRAILACQVQIGGE